MAQSKEYNKSPEINLKEEENYELPDKELKIIILENFNELQKHRTRQLNVTRKTSITELKELTRGVQQQTL